MTIHTSGGPDELRQLLDWFDRDDALRGLLSVPPSRIRDGQMGDLYDVLVVAVGAGGLARALTQSLTVWLTHRRSDITITLERSNGTAVTLNGDRVKSSDVLRELRDLLNEPDASR